jgi:glyoxylase-like metal-dependent hydrolase (beta-lactamase superfamily II)
METETHCFHIGDFECIAINDGTHAYKDPADNIFINAPRKQLGAALITSGIILDEWTEYLSPYTCLLIKTDLNTVLVDTGAGTSFDPGLGNLPGLIQNNGISLQEIDTVLITHAHPDHIGGNIFPDGQVAFPQARYMISKAEWEYWSSEKTLREGGFFVEMVRKQLLAISDRFTLVEPDLEIFPGIRVIAAPGHTPGYICVELHSRAQKLFIIGDAFLHPLQIEQPGWYSIVDIQPDLMVRTRLELLKRAAEERLMVLAFHFPFPGLGFIYREGDVYHWEPVS